MTPAHRPDWSQTYISHYLWQPEYDSIRLPVAGYLIAVGVCVDISSEKSALAAGPDARYRAVFHFQRESDDKSAPPLAVINWEWMLNQCGVAFPAPIPDVNTVNAHVVRRVAPVKTDVALRVTTVHLGLTFS